MSVPLDLYFQSPMSIDDFHAWALDNLGLTFKKFEGARSTYYTGCHLRSALFLEQTTSKELEGYDLRRMNLRLSLDPFSGDAALLNFIVLSCAVMSRMDPHNGLLICNLEIPLARYVYGGRGLFDELSGSSVEFPEHVTNVFKAWRKSTLSRPGK